MVPEDGRNQLVPGPAERGNSQTQFRCWTRNGTINLHRQRDPCSYCEVEAVPYQCDTSLTQSIVLFLPCLTLQLFSSLPTSSSRPCPGVCTSQKLRAFTECPKLPHKPSIQLHSESVSVTTPNTIFNSTSHDLDRPSNIVIPSRHIPRLSGLKHCHLVDISCPGYPPDVHQWRVW